MKRLILLLVCFLSLTELQANGITDHRLFDSIEVSLQAENNRMSQSDSNQAPHGEINTSDVISTLTLIVNSLNNALTSTNNQVTVWALVLSLLTLIAAGAGLVEFVRLRKIEKEFEDFKTEHKRVQDYQREKEKVRNVYMKRINGWMFQITFQLANNNNSDTENAYKAFKETFIGYYFIRLGVIDFPIGKVLTEELQQAKREMAQALDPIIERGEWNDLRELQEMSDAEINEEKKKMLKNAAKELQNRLIAETNAKSTPQSRRERREKTPAATES